MNIEIKVFEFLMIFMNCVNWIYVLIPQFLLSVECGSIIAEQKTNLGLADNEKQLINSQSCLNA